MPCLVCCTFLPPPGFSNACLTTVRLLFDERHRQGNVSMVYLATPEGTSFMMGPLDKPAKERKAFQRREKIVVSYLLLCFLCFWMCFLRVCARVCVSSKQGEDGCWVIAKSCFLVSRV